MQIEIHEDQRGAAGRRHTRPPAADSATPPPPSETTLSEGTEGKVLSASRISRTSAGWSSMSRISLAKGSKENCTLARAGKKLFCASARIMVGMRSALFFFSCLTLAAQDRTLGLDKEAALGRQMATEEVRRSSTPAEPQAVQDYVAQLGARLTAWLPNRYFPYAFSSCHY